MNKKQLIKLIEQWDEAERPLNKEGILNIINSIKE